MLGWKDEEGRMFNMAQLAHARSGSGATRLIRRVVVLVFAVIQAVLVGRILLDLGVIPAEGLALQYLVPWSDALAAPVSGLAGLGGLSGGGVPGMGGLPGMGGVGGQGLNPVMLGALFGWTVVEGLVLRVVGKFSAV